MISRYVVLLSTFFFYSYGYDPINVSDLIVASDLPSLSDVPGDLTRALTTTLIQRPGFYFLTRPFANSITIRASDVILDLVGNTVQGTIDIGTGLKNVTVRNGIIASDTQLSAGIRANSACQNISVLNMRIVNSDRGIYFDAVTNGIISNCELSQNSTGVELIDAHNIYISDTVASQNEFVGFGLLRTTTCVIQDCKALSTGQGNTAQENNTVVGFVSTDGYGNIFERCIANSTQALSTTDSNSLVSGFALRGSEGCTKIIECESANATTSPSGVTVPYGILLEAQFDGLVTVTVHNPGGGGADTVRTIAWSPDGKYLVVGGDLAGNQVGDLYLYKFDRHIGVLTQLQVTTPGGVGSQRVNSVDWSPDGKYLAVGLNVVVEDLLVYRFDTTQEMLIQVQAVSPGGISSDAIFSVAWSPDGRFLAVGGSINPSNDLRIYLFNRISETLGEVYSVDVGGIVNSVDWSSDGKYLAISAEISSQDSEIQIYRFERSSQSLLIVETVNFYGYLGVDINSVMWSPDGKYLLMGGLFTDSLEVDLFIYRFERDSEMLVQVQAINPGGGNTSDTVHAIAWSPDGTYFAVGGGITGGAGEDLLIYRFDRGLENATLKEAINPGGGSGDIVRAIAWSPDGVYLAVGGFISGGGDEDLIIYNSLNFPSTNIIKGNTVYCNSGGNCPSGVGISGSSIQNLIIGNTAYGNPLLRQGFGGQALSSAVSTNYAFVTNVFNPLFGQAPTALQNISVGDSQPICMPADLVLLLEQAKAKACTFVDDIAQIISKAETISLVGPCDPTSLSAGPISTEGSYCLAADIASGGLAINASNVVLDLNGHSITGGVTITGRDQITLKNGVVQNAGANGITATSSTNIIVENITARSSLLGINFQSVDGGTIKNCTLTQNTTGLELSGSAQITIESCIADCNTHAGFCLLTSTSCFVLDCKALSTGQGNTVQQNNTVVGFVSTDGYGNIFERCIANSTQALSTTDSNSLVSGFALRGSEQCSKIIECESANATTSPSGVTVPYGILLQATLNNPITLTAASPIPIPGASVQTLNWSPDGSYLAVGIASADTQRIRIYQFDRINNIVTQVATPDVIPGDTVFSVNWSVDGVYLAAGMSSTSDTQRIRIYQFDKINNILTQVATPNVIPGSSVRAVDWSPDGSYLAAGIQATDTQRIRIYQFNRSSNTLTQVATPNVIPGDTVQTLNWSPNGSYLAVGMASADTQRIRIYQFNKGSNTLTQVATPDVIPGAGGLSVDWSPDGSYLAVGMGSTSDTQRIRIYQFNRSINTLTQVATPDVIPGDRVFSVNWSSDGTYLAAGIDSAGDTQRIRIYQFDRSSNTLTQVSTPNVIPSDIVNSVNWSPDGSYLAAGIASVDTQRIRIYDALTFPSKNVITQNTVYCNSGARFPSGVGISGSSIQNLIIGNTAYGNPLLPSTSSGSTGGGAGSTVNSNYQFVTNVFNQLFGQAPTALQNISVGNSQQICMQDDLGLLLQQVCAKVINLGKCGPTTLTNVSGTTSLTESGNYCLGEDATADIVITGTCISLDLNNRCLTGLISITASQDVIVKNGNVTPAAPTSAPSAAITIAASTLVVQIKEVAVACANTITSGVAGRDGISIAGHNVVVDSCSIVSGVGGNNTGASTAGNGGAGIIIADDSEQTVIQNCIIQTGAGGSTGSGTAGAGGNGITVADGAAKAEIVGCTIMSTGTGGATSGTAGAAGHGIFINSAAVDIAVRECTIRNTGQGGSVGGLPGKAVFDLVTASTDLSQIFKNFAHNIANQTKFDIQAPSIAGGPEDGILSPNPPDATVLNPFANIYTTP